MFADSPQMGFCVALAPDGPEGFVGVFVFDSWSLIAGLIMPVVICLSYRVHDACSLHGTQTLSSVQPVCTHAHVHVFACVRTCVCTGECCMCVWRAL